MIEEKIRCQFCGRRNHTNNDLCESCGAWLPDPVKSTPRRLYDDMDETEMAYLNQLVTYTAFTYRDGQLVGVRP